jgi:hypothetical protein
MMPIFIFFWLFLFLFFCTVLLLLLFSLLNTVNNYNNNSHRAVNNGILDDSVFITYIKPVTDKDFNTSSEDANTTTKGAQGFVAKTTNWTDGTSTSFPHGSISSPKPLAEDGQRHPLVSKDDPRRYVDGGSAFIERAATITERGMESFNAQPYLPRDSIEVRDVCE